MKELLKLSLLLLFCLLNTPIKGSIISTKEAVVAIAVFEEREIGKYSDTADNDILPKNKYAQIEEQFIKIISFQSGLISISRATSL